VPNLPNLGATPGVAEFNDPLLTDVATLVSTTFNEQLDAELDSARAALGLEIFEIDTFALFEQFRMDPSAFGFTNVTDAAFDEDTGDLVDMPNDYLFWDRVHPTAPGHEHFAEFALAQIPAPGGMAVVVAGGVFAARRRR